MRIAIFSDIHGNGVALDAVLADLKAQAVDQYLCLGDAIQSGPQPAYVVARLRELGCPVVLGNADAWMLTGEETGAEPIPEERLRKMKAVRQWSLAQLSADDQAFIAAFQPTVQLDPGGVTLLGYHGSPRSFDDVILPDSPADQIAAYLAGQPADIYCGGHTHVQFLRRLGPGPAYHFNPGSVGFAYSHHQQGRRFQADPWAEYAILSVERGRSALSFHRTPLDVAALITAYLESGRPFADEAAAQYQGG